MDYSDGTPGQFRDFRKDDFEPDWIKLSDGRFGQVYQVKLKLCRDKCALKTFNAKLSPNNCYR